jgi:transposase InsO family protein
MKREQSMSRRGHGWDNSPTERFFRSMKHEQLNYENSKPSSGKTERDRLFGFLQWPRVHSSLDYLSPSEFEREFYRNAA